MTQKSSKYSKMLPLAVFIIYLTTNQNMSSACLCFPRSGPVQYTLFLLDKDVCVSEYSRWEVLGLVPQSICPLLFSPRSLHSHSCFLSLCMCLLIDSGPVIGCSIEAYPVLVCVCACVLVCVCARYTAVGRLCSSALMLTLTVQSKTGAFCWHAVLYSAWGFAKVK